MGRPHNSFLLVIAFAASCVIASFPIVHDPFSTRNTLRMGRRGLDIEVFHPPSTLETFGDGIAQPDSVFRARGDPPRQARGFVAQRLRLQQSAVGYRSGYPRGGIQYAYLSQTINGLSVVNAVSNVAFKEDKVVSFGSSFVKPESRRKNSSPFPFCHACQYIPKAEEILDGKHNGHPTRVVYLARPDGSPSLVYGVQIGNEEANQLYEAFIDAHSGQLLSATDFSADAAYRVLPLRNQFLPEGVELVTDPQDQQLVGIRGLQAICLSFPYSYTGQGNSVFAWKGNTGNLTFQSSDETFDYTYDSLQPPNVTVNVNAARTNAFYIDNTVHDFAYRYGFTEEAFNFQDDNFGKGDWHGQPGFCRMYIWALTLPNRDGSLSNDILMHELAHGISNRLTGGGTSACLQTLESRALGEGWSDAIANWALQKSANVTDFVVAGYTENKPKGIRMYPYSTNMTTFPSTYSTINRWFAIYRVGGVWANMLHNVYAALVAERGWAADAFTNTEGPEGNIVFMHLLMDALALQPCSPAFESARDAWFQADANMYGGAFASRGLGPNTANRKDDFTVPLDCA
ncbi:metalloprotease [Coprinopsis sp. MPI-PUGE-AT-0042]|nr:metalloprotease [Coprinopsis sp. MPI-PUGE-AT-0042]